MYCNLNLNDDFGENLEKLIYSTIENNDLALLNALIERGAKPLDYSLTPTYSLVSLEEDNPVVFERLVELGMDPKHTLTHDKHSLLMDAFINGLFFKAAVALIEVYCVDVNTRDSNGFTVLHYAVQNKAYPEHVDYLIEKGAQIDAVTKDGDNAFQLACAAGSRLLIPKLYDLLNPDVNAYDSQGHAPLMQAIINEDESSMKFLLERGAYINKPSKDGSIPISFAVNDCASDVIELLISYGASLNILPPGASQLPIHKVAEFEDECQLKEILPELIALGIDVNARDKDGNTAIHTAIIKFANGTSKFT